MGRICPSCRSKLGFLDKMGKCKRCGLVQCQKCCKKGMLGGGKCFKCNAGLQTI